MPRASRKETDANISYRNDEQEELAQAGQLRFQRWVDLTDPTTTNGVDDDTEEQEPKKAPQDVDLVVNGLLIIIKFGFSFIVQFHLVVSDEAQATHAKPMQKVTQPGGKTIVVDFPTVEVVVKHLVAVDPPFIQVGGIMRDDFP